MNSQTLGGLASDQKIDKVFHAFGHSIPVGKDGRRMWPTKFKREMARQMILGKLTVNEIQRTCQVSDKAVYQWKKKFGKSSKKGLPPVKAVKKAFAEIKVVNDQPKLHAAVDGITFKRGAVELQLPPNYPVIQLAQLIRALDCKT